VGFVRKGVGIRLTKKVNVTLYLDKELVNRARLMGFNLSKLMENILRETLGKMDFPCGSTWNNRNSPDSEKPQNEPVFTQPSQKMVGRDMQLTN